ncbi:alpha-mannosidase [Mycolicibacillus koreensis]|nr:alpha-mannosidase [Mycolicibacillus koreensis]
MRVLSVEATELFVGPAQDPQQLVRLTYTGCVTPTPVHIGGDGVSGRAVADPSRECLEIPVRVHGAVPGQRRHARLHTGESADAGSDFTFTVAEPGWTMYLIGHFHYDPVWWNTQANYTSAWTEDPPGACRQDNGLNLVAAHLELARRDPDYRFVLAELDYLKPFWDTHPQHRAELRRLLADGRVEVMGGCYNEPSTTLTGTETTVRTLIHGIGFQRDVLGADPATGWQLDVFGHDPQYPGLAADAGLSSTAWARGPHHQWGPMADGGDPRRMQFPSEFEWIAPSGRGVLTHYMPAHYAAGWWMDAATDLAAAEEAVYDLFCGLKKVAATRNVLLPVGTDFTPPNRWITAIHRDWAARYTWPRFVCALPRDFFAAVRAELAARRVEPAPQTRDMNPIYTGCAVSYIDTKQAHRAAEQVVGDAERFATFAAALTGMHYPQAALTKAWTQLAYGAHHDAITGSESDQVYLDLLTGWRDAWQLGTAARRQALAALSAAVGGVRDVVVWNPVAEDRTDLVTVHLGVPLPAGVRVLNVAGSVVPAHVDDNGHTVTWRADQMPSLGWQSYRLVPAETVTGWTPIAGTGITNGRHHIAVDPDRGGGVASWRRDGRELIADGAVGNELTLYEEYPAHPRSGEGPWHLVPSGRVDGSADCPAERVQAYRGPLGERLVVHGRLAGRFGPRLAYTQTLTVWHGIDRVDCTTRVEGFTGSDELLRLRWPCPVPGALPVAEVGDAVIGRGFALLHTADGRSVDTARQPWTLDTAAHRWFALSSTARVRIGAVVRAIGVAEVVLSAGSGIEARRLMTALAGAGVTATCGHADRPRYGDLSVDSNLPDVRLAIGGPQRNTFTRAVLAAADPAYTAELNRQLEARGHARVWVPAATPLTAVWTAEDGPVDLRAPRALPVLIVAGGQAAVDALVDDLVDAEIAVAQHPPPGAAEPEPFEERTVALLNRGTPGVAVDTAGTLHTALLRSCTGWPSGAWTDGPRRTAPDGSPFQSMHWTHTFDYALVAADGDWRAAGIAGHAARFAAELQAVLPPAADTAGALPPTGALLRADTAGAVRVGAVKPTGNPLAHGSARPVDPAAVTVRLTETHGRPAEVDLRTGPGRLDVLGRADLLEQPRAHDTPRRLHGYETATVLTRLRVDPIPTRPSPPDPRLDTEAAQPLFARYWLHNRGPAPLGGLPAVAHLHPPAAQTGPGERLGLRLTAASDCTDTALTAELTVTGAPGWATAPVRTVSLAPGAHTDTEVVVDVPAHAEAGLYPVTARLRLTDPGLPAAWGQPVEDVCVVTVGDPAAARLLYLVDEPAEVDLSAGDRATLSVTVGTDARADLAVEAHLISPWGTWEWTGPPCRGATVPAGGTATLRFAVAPPPWVSPGQWWALIRVGAAGRLLYSPAVRLVVR